MTILRLELSLTTAKKSSKVNPACSVLRYTPQLSAAKMVQMHQSGTFRVLPIADQVFTASLHYLPSHRSAVPGRSLVGNTADHMTCSMLPCRTIHSHSAHTGSVTVLLHLCKLANAAANVPHNCTVLCMCHCLGL